MSRGGFGCIIQSKRYFSPNKYQEELISRLKSDDFKRDVNQILLDEARAQHYIPHKSGALERDGKVRKDGVVYTKEYAQYQYWGKVYGPNLMAFKLMKFKGQPFGTEGLYRSPKGKKKYPTGRNIGSIDATWEQGGYIWKLGYSSPGSHAKWLHVAYENNKRSISLKITNMLKRRLKQQ